MNKKGFTISEVLIALALFCVFVVPLTGLLHHIVSDTGVRHKIIAMRLARNSMEHALAFPKSVNSENTTVDGFEVKQEVEGSDLKKVKITVMRNGKQLFVLQSLVYSG